MAAPGGNDARLERSRSRRQSIIPSFDLFFRMREEEDEAGLPVGWGESTGNSRADADLRFGRAIIIYNGKTFPIRWLNSAAMLRPFEREHLSAPMQTLRRQLHALNNAHSAVAHDLREADGRLAQLNCLVMRVHDPLETALGAGADAFFDTDLIHGYTQRVRMEQVMQDVPRMVVDSIAVVSKFHTTTLAIDAKRRSIAGAQLVRIARGWLGRLRASEYRYMLTMDAAATAIQAVYWGYMTRKYIIPRVRHAKRARVAAIVQAVWRGHRVRQWYGQVKDLESYRAQNKAAEMFQAAWKGCWTRHNRQNLFMEAEVEKEVWQEKRRTRLADARSRRHARRILAATDIQRIVRGFFARREVYMRRQQGFIAHPRVRQLADNFLAGGDLWGLLAAVSADYEKSDAAREREQRQASAFVQQMVRHRESQEANDWESWIRARSSTGRAAKGGGHTALPALPASMRGGGSAAGRAAAAVVDGRVRGRAASLLQDERGAGDVTLSDEDLRLAVMERMYLRAGPTDAEIAGAAGAGQGDVRPGVSLAALPGPGAASSGKFLGRGAGTGRLSAAMASSSKLAPLAATGDTTGHGLPRYRRELQEANGASRGRANVSPMRGSGRSQMQSHSGASLLMDESTSSFLAERSRRGRARTELGLPAGADPDEYVRLTGATSVSLRKATASRTANHRHSFSQSGEMRDTIQSVLVPPSVSGAGPDANAASQSFADHQRSGSTDHQRSGSTQEGRLGSTSTSGFVMPGAGRGSGAEDAEGLEEEKEATSASGFGPGQSMTDGAFHAPTLMAKSNADGQPEPLPTALRSTGTLPPLTLQTSQGDSQVGDEQSLFGKQSSAGSTANAAANAAAEAGHSGVSQAADLTSSSFEDGAPAHQSADARQAADDPPQSVTVAPSLWHSQTQATSTSTAPHIVSSTGTGIGGGGSGNDSVSSKKDAVLSSLAARGASVLHDEASAQDALQGRDRVGRKYRDATGPTDVKGPVDNTGVSFDVPPASPIAVGAATASLTTPGGNPFALVPFGGADSGPTGNEGGRRAGGDDRMTSSRQPTSTTLITVRARTPGLSDETAIAASLEDSLASRAVGRPPARSLMRDVRGLDGPHDALCLHAALRVVPIPEGVLRWYNKNVAGGSTGRAGVIPPSLSAGTVEAARAAAASGTLMGAPAPARHMPAEPGRAKRGRKAVVEIGADFDKEGAGEEAAKLFAELPPSLLKVRWESAARDVAAPVVAALQRQGVRCVRDVLSADMEAAGIDPIVIGTIHRLVRVMSVAERMTAPSTVRAMYQERQKPLPPPLFGPGRAAKGGKSRQKKLNDGVTRPFGAAAAAAEARAESEAAVRAARLGVGGSASVGHSGRGSRSRSGTVQDDPASAASSAEDEEEEEEEEGVGVGAAGFGAGSLPPDPSDSTLPYWAAAARSGAGGSGLQAVKRPRRRHLRGSAGKNPGKATLYITRSDPSGVPVAHRAALQSRGRAATKSGAGTSHISPLTLALMEADGRGTSAKDDRQMAGPLLYSEAALFGSYGAASDYISADARDGEKLGRTAATGATLLTSTRAPSSDAVGSTMTRRHGGHGRRGGGRADDGLLLSKDAWRVTDSAVVGDDEIVLPSGFAILDRDEGLTASGIRQEARAQAVKEKRRLKAAAERGKARSIAKEATMRALKAVRDARPKESRLSDRSSATGNGEDDDSSRDDGRLPDIDTGTGSAGRALPSDGSALSQAALLVSLDATGHTATDAEPGDIDSTAGDDAGRAAANALESTMAMMLARLHGSVNTLAAVTSLEGPIDPACAQAALRLPLPMPKMVEMSDYRTGIKRSDAERSRVLVPYDLFLRQLVAYEAAAAAGVGARGGGHGSAESTGNAERDRVARVAEAEEAAAKKQKMLVRERLGVAQVMSKPWIRALNRGGFTRIGQLVKMPRLELTRCLRSAYPLKPEAGATLAGRRAQELAGNIPPSRVASLLEASLEHWIASTPAIADQVYLRVTSFDPRFQKKATDSRSAAPAARAMASAGRALGSADWRTFEKQRYGTQAVSLRPGQRTRGRGGDRAESKAGGTLAQAEANAQVYHRANALDDSVGDGLGSSLGNGAGTRNLVAPLGFSTEEFKEQQELERQRRRSERDRLADARGDRTRSTPQTAGADQRSLEALERDQKRALPPPIVLESAPTPGLPARVLVR